MSNNAAFVRAASSMEVTPTLKVGGNPGKIPHNPLDNVTKISHSEASISAKASSVTEHAALRSTVAKEAAEAAAANKGLYNPHEFAELLKKNNPGKTVTSTTVPMLKDPNVRFAENPSASISGIGFDANRLPIFDEHSAFSTILKPDVAAIKDRIVHFEAAAADLKAVYESGAIRYERFVENELSRYKRMNLELGADFTMDQIRGKVDLIMESIAKGGGANGKIPGYTWHHDRNRKLQLIPDDLHKDVRHVGGFAMWYR